MDEFVTLSCPSCGGKLEITQDIERFACAHCGREQIVKRGGGIISLSPIVDGLKRVESGADKTAAELAIPRLSKEISLLKNEKAILIKDRPYPTKLSPANLYFVIFIGGVFLLPGLYGLINKILSTSSLQGGYLFPIVIGAGLIFAGYVSLSNQDKRLVIEIQNWEKVTGEKIKFLDDQLASKKLKLEQNSKLVSQ